MLYTRVPVNLLYYYCNKGKYKYIVVKLVNTILKRCDNYEFTVCTRLVFLAIKEYAFVDRDQEKVIQKNVKNLFPARYYC